MKAFRYALLLLILFSLFCMPLVASAVTVDVSFESETIYPDSKDVNVVVNIDGLTNGVYSFDYSGSNVFIATFEKKDCYNISENQNNTGCSVSLSNNYVRLGITNVPTDIPMSFKISFSLNSNANLSRTPDEFKYELCQNVGIDCELKSSGTETLSYNTNYPKGSLVLLDSNNQTPEDSAFSKADTVFAKLTGVADNIDDLGGENLYCNYNVKQGTNVKKSGTQEYTTVNLSEKEFTLSSFTPTEVGTGEFTFNFDCNDKQNGGRSFSDSMAFKIIDRKADINSISLTPSDVYPNKEVTCNATAKDFDDPNDTFTYTYEWWLAGTKKAITTNKFNCATNACSTGNELKCVVKATGVSGTSDPKEVKATIKSYYTNVSISGQDKVQKNNDETFTANLNYNGTGTTTYKWNFGDGATATTKEAKHKYTENGNYTINLEVNDGKGSKANATKSITVVDPDIIIDIKNPVQNQDLERGSEISIKVQVTDNTNENVNNALVRARITDGTNSSAFVTLKKIDNSAGMYEGKLIIPYLISENPEIEVDANYTKNNMKITGKKGRVVNLLATELKPEFIIETLYSEVDNTKLGAGNKINKITICFALPDNGFDNLMVSTLKLIIVGQANTEFELMKENYCYVSEPNYVIPELDELSFKLKDPKDVYGNYVKNGYTKSYDVRPLPEAFIISIVEPSSDSINIGQTVNVKIKLELKSGVTKSDLKELKGYLEYKTNKIDLNYLEQDNSIFFVGKLLPDAEDIITFTVRVDGKYQEGIAVKETKKTLNATNALKVQLISPSAEGIVYDNGKIIFDIKYSDNTKYQQNQITVTINDKNILLTKINSGEYAGFYGANYATKFFSKANYNVKGEYASGNVISLSTSLPALSYKFSLTFYYLFAGILIIVIILIFVVGFIMRRQKILESKYHEKTLEELQEEQKALESTVSELKKSFFKGQLSEDGFKQQKIEVEQRLAIIDGKIKAMQEKSTGDSALDKDNAIRELITFFIQNNWSIEAIKKYLQDGSVPDKTIDYIVARISEMKK